MDVRKPNFFHRANYSAIWTVLGVLFLFAISIAITMVAPHHVDLSWTQPSSAYQVLMYEVVDPNLYINAAAKSGLQQQFICHLKNNYTLSAFVETARIKIIAPPELEFIVTKEGDPYLKLTSRLLFLKKELQNKAQEEDFLHEIYELYDPQIEEGFAYSLSESAIENWVDGQFYVVDEKPQQKFHTGPGVIYVKNPTEYLFEGSRVGSLEELKSDKLGFLSRQELIKMGEQLFAIEGCFYCHTDQSRTLIQDAVLNGSEAFPAPPSSANEYIYQEITFPGTRRIGPDLARVGVKRPSREWNMFHFWSPRSASAGSIMPEFRHFFHAPPTNDSEEVVGIPNEKFEAIFQYLMTKGTRITAPTQAWWEGKDPIQTVEILDGRKTSGYWK